MEKFYYIVSHTVSEHGSSNVAIKDSFEEAKELIKDLSDWWCSKGSGRITEYNQNMQETQVWFFRDNEVVDYFDRRKYLR